MSTFSSEQIVITSQESGILSDIENLQSSKASLSGATFTGVVDVVSPVGENSVGTRRITISTSAPSGGSDGDVWIVYQ